jgi:hypothetical protein
MVSRESYHSGTNSVLQQQDENCIHIVANFIYDSFISIVPRGLLSLLLSTGRTKRFEVCDLVIHGAYNFILDS